MKREIVELDDLLLIEAAVVAKQQGKSLDDVIGTALREYVEANIQPPNLPFIGIVDVPPTWTQEDMDQELMDGLHPHEGWTHDPRPVPADDKRQKNS